MVWYSEIRSPAVSCFIVVTKESMPSSTVRPFSLLKCKNNEMVHAILLAAPQNWTSSSLGAGTTMPHTS